MDAFLNDIRYAIRNLIIKVRVKGNPQITQTAC